MKFNMNEQPYGSNRFPVIAHRGMVCTGNNLASAAGIRILQKGGNAIDAAIATAACLTVVEPTANGIGSDAFAIVWHKGKLQGLNSTGCAPELLSIDSVMKKHGKSQTMPTHGWTPITVPGAPKAWAELNQKYGKLSLLEDLEPAIEYARKGFPVSREIARMWDKAFQKMKERSSDEFEEWFKTFTFDGNPPKAGQIITLKNHANTLEEIGRSNADSFYQGTLADQIEKESIKHNGFIRKKDLMNHEALWVDPISVHYKGYDIWEIPPNGQGIVALMALNILKEFEFDSRDTDLFHKQFEAMKMAFADGKAYVSDPRKMTIDYHSLIDPSYGKQRANTITDIAQEPKVDMPYKSGTVYLCTADDEGNMVSYIQSNYMGFGSGIVVKDTGISLQNRGYDFSLDPTHVNALEPNKRTYHTIIPGFITKQNQPIGPFGVMGGYMQPQGHVQVAMNLIDFHLNPQMALDAPRWQWIQGMEFIVEEGFEPEIIEELTKKGHQIRVEKEVSLFGRGQMILKMDTGALIGGCESRTDSNIACY